jgi:hypothetical protein
MAKVKKEDKQEEDGILKTVAKAVGSAAGTVAAAAGVTAPKAPAPPRVRAATRAGRLLPKNKSRLPRKAKKALQTEAAKKTAAH